MAAFKPSLLKPSRFRVQGLGYGFGVQLRDLENTLSQPVLAVCKYVRQRSGTKSDQNLAKGHVLFQKHLGTAAMPIKGGTQEAKCQRLLSLELHATQKRLERPEREEGRRNWHRACRKTRCERKRRGTFFTHGEYPASISGRSA